MNLGPFELIVLIVLVAIVAIPIKIAKSLIDHKKRDTPAPQSSQGEAVSATGMTDLQFKSFLKGLVAELSALRDTTADPSTARQLENIIVRFNTDIK